MGIKYVKCYNQPFIIDEKFNRIDRYIIAVDQMLIVILYLIIFDYNFYPTIEHSYLETLELRLMRFYHLKLTLAEARANGHISPLKLHMLF